MKMLEECRVALVDIAITADMYITCAAGECMECDLLRKILDTAKSGMGEDAWDSLKVEGYVESCAARLKQS